MTNRASPHSHFQVSSGALCFGNRQEVRQGGQAEIQTPSCPDFVCDGGATVFSHAFRYNLQARNGQWNVYPLRSRNNGIVRAAFCAHESLDAYQEAKRIVDVANAPWEKDNGTDRNTQETWDGRVVVINRYDWIEGYYEEAEDGITLGEEDLITMGGGQRNSRWLVDHAQARQQPDNGSCETWCTSGQGARLVVFGEYIHGRFGLSQDQSQVQSFLLFTGDTDLAQSTFHGDDRPVYVPLTDEERHAKRLADGSYSGFAWLRSPACRDQFPEDLVGPFGVQDMISRETMEAILRTVQPTVPVFEPQLQQDVTQLLNESLAVWVYCLGKLASEANTREEFIREAFPNSLGKNQSSVHAMQLKAMERDDGLEVVPEMLHKIVHEGAKLWNLFTTREVSCGLKYLLTEILELSGNSPRDNGRKALVPYDVRSAINYDNELCDECLNCSKVFWPPDMWNSEA